MERGFTGQSICKSRLLKVLFLLVLVLGVLFRFAGLEHKFFWDDEVRTVLRVSGYTPTDIVEQVYDGRVIGVEALAQFKSPNPERDLGDALQALMTHPEHPPLYYLMTRFWMQGLGNSLAVIRSLPVVFGLLAFPCLYWLCLELFGSVWVGGVAIAIFAVSPLNVLYAQEARQYSLWTLAVLLSSAALLRALRSKTRASWVLYAATLALGLYSHLLFGLIIVGHGIYIVGIEGIRWRGSIRHYCQALFVALLAFSPWLGVMVVHASQVNRAVTAVVKRTEVSYLVDVWFRSINRVFFSADLGSANLILVFFVLYSIYFIGRYTPKRIWLFLLTLIGVTALCTMLPDLVLGGTRSTRLRYLMPSYLGIQLTAAYFFTQQITFVKTWRQRAWRLFFLLIIATGVLGCTLDTQTQVTWNKGDDNAKRYLQVADTIQHSPRPLIVSDTSLKDNDPAPVYVLKLSYELDPTVKLQLTTQPNIPEIPAGFSNIFLFYPSPDLLNALAERPDYHLVPIIDRETFKFWEVFRL